MIPIILLVQRGPPELEALPVQVLAQEDPRHQERLAQEPDPGVQREPVGLVDLEELPVQVLAQEDPRHQERLEHRAVARSFQVVLAAI